MFRMRQSTGTASLAAAKTRFSALVEEAVGTHEQIMETLAILQNPADRAEFDRARHEADAGDVTGEEEMASLMRERLGKRDDE